MNRFVHLVILCAVCLLTLTMPAILSSRHSSGGADGYFVGRLHAEEASAANLVLTTAIHTGDATVRNGDVVTYTINLKQEGGDGSLMVEIGDVLSWPLRLAGRPTLTEITPTVETTDVRLKHGRDEEGLRRTFLGWRGRLSPDAEVQITFPVRAYARCQSGDPTDEIVNVVRARTPDSAFISAEASFDVTCPNVSLEDIEVTLETEEESDADAPTTATGEALNIAAAGNDGSTQKFTVAMTNHSQERVVLGYQLGQRSTFIGDDLGLIDETDKYIDEMARSIPQSPTEPTDAGRLFSSGILFPARQVILHPAETRTFEVWTDMRPLLRRLNELDEGDSEGTFAIHQENNTDDGLLVDFNLRYALLSYMDSNLVLDPGESIQMMTTTQQIHLRPWDLGDAPTGSNHFDAPMSAYPDVEANFPTVFDPEVSAVQGPAHARPRHFYLGYSVDQEPDADLGPAPNVVPGDNSPNYDRFDDGVNPHSWNLSDCRPTTVRVRLFVSPEAATWFASNGLTGYLNGWLDSNRDGDWGDSVPCPSDDKMALEHVIVDEEIDVAALEPGYHSVSVTTGRVSWPAETAGEPAWVRLTLSEQPSAKIGSVAGVEYGDGRGHVRPLRTGETEDYLLRPAGSDGAGPDVAVTMTGNWWPVPSSTETASLSVEKVELGLRTDFVNQGTEPARDAVLTFAVPEGLRGQDAEIVLTPELRPDAVDVSEDQIVVTLGTLDPGERAQLLIAFRGSKGATYEARSTVTTTQDVNPANDTAAFKVEITGGISPDSFGFKSPDAPFAVQRGTTNSSDLIIQGFYQERIANEGFLVKVWVHRLLDARRSDAGPEEVYEVPVGEDGRWSLNLENLPNGVYQFAVDDPAACDAHSFQPGPDWEDSGWRSLHGYGTVCGLAVVNTRLAVDPISIAFTDGNGRTLLVDTLHWLQGDWRIDLPQGEYTATMNMKGDFSRAHLSGTTAFGSFETKLEETEVPGRYQGNFIIGDGGGFPGLATDDPGLISLQIETDFVQTKYDGTLAVTEPGQVQNAVTGDSLAGATVTLLAPAASGDTLIFAPWDGSEHGYTNPVTTGVDGRYVLRAPAGLYQLHVTADGYQPFRTGVLSGDGANITRTLTLTRTVGPADAVIAITADGFEPAVSAVQPNSVIEFVNTDESARRVTGSDFDSGLLLMGESFSMRVGESGVVSFEDDTNPASGGALIVDPHAGLQFLFLPVVLQ